MAIQLGPVPHTNEKDNKRQNVAIQQLFDAFNAIVGQLPGTSTNDDAAAGNVGEYMTQAAANVSLTASTPVSLVHLVLTAGDWEVWGNSFITGDPTTKINNYQIALSTTVDDVDTGTFPDPTVYSEQLYGDVLLSLSHATGFTAFVGPKRVKVSSAATTTIYLNIRVNFHIDTCAAYGTISARRAR